MSSYAPRFAATCLKNEVHGSLEASPPIPKAASTELRGLEASGRGIPKAMSTELLPSRSTRPAKDCSPPEGVYQRL